MAKALEGIRDYWVAALAERRDDPAPRDGDLVSHLLHATFDDRPLTDAELLDMLTVLVLAGLDTTRASSATSSGISRRIPSTAAAWSRSPS